MAQPQRAQMGTMMPPGVGTKSTIEDLAVAGITVTAADEPKLGLEPEIASRFREALVRARSTTYS